MIGEWLDSLVGIVSPANGLKRAAARQAYQKVRAQSYEAGKLDRTTQKYAARPEAGDSANLSEVQRLRYRAWGEYRNNPYARKVVRALLAQIIGQGLRPESQADTPTGEANEPFRERAELLWNYFSREPDYLGKPGRGGKTIQQFWEQALRETILSGECFIRIIKLTQKEARERGLVIPLTLELIEAERCIESYTYGAPIAENGNTQFRGIEFNSRGERVAYHFYKVHPQDPKGVGARTDYERIPAEDILHIYLQDRPSQQRGVSWFAPALLQIRDASDYQYNELMSATVSSCFSVFVVRGPNSGQLGFTTPTGGDTTDTDGNSLTRLQPGMIGDLRPGEDIKTVDPKRQGSGVNDFMTLMLRGIAVGFPGIKASTVTGDYRGSSFASEKSNDNDVWRETAQIQDWFSDIATQPVWERVQHAGIEMGWFEKLDGRTGWKEQYKAQPRLFLAASWQGPVAKSIQLVADYKAAQQAIEAGLWNVIDASAADGKNFRDNAKKMAKAFKYLQELDLPLAYVLSIMGVETTGQSQPNAEQIIATGAVPATPTTPAPPAKKSDSNGHANRIAEAFEELADAVALQPAPIVNVNLPSPAVKRTVERDADGLIVSTTDTPE